MNEELTKAANAFGEALVYAVRAFGEFASAFIRHFAQPMKSLVESVNEYYATQEHATPNERRMMHHRKKRIRRKYYNRVKRRIMG
jgi:hypothetical protein